MRMDTDQQWSARDVVNGYSETQLAWVLRTHGDEKYAARIAKAIVAAAVKTGSKRRALHSSSVSGNELRPSA